MDLLRTCYTHWVWFDDAKTIGDYITWYRCSDNALWFPAPHVFSSERYDTVHWYNPGAGEDELAKPAYYNGVPPARFTGQQFCGPVESYLGAPSNAPALLLDSAGWPACCQIPEGYYHSEFNPSVNPPPPSGPSCAGCQFGIGPQTFKVTLSGFFPTNCRQFNGTWTVTNTGVPCLWRGSIVTSVGTFQLDLSLAPGFAFCGVAGQFSFTPPPLPMNCFATQTWTRVISSDVCSSGFISMTSQPG